MKTADSSECIGVNSREHLAFVEQVMRQRIRTRWLKAGVTMLDPRTTFIDDPVTIGMDTVLYPGVTLEGQTAIGAECVIRSHSRVTNSVVGKVRHHRGQFPGGECGPGGPCHGRAVCAPSSRFGAEKKVQSRQFRRI